MRWLFSSCILDDIGKNDAIGASDPRVRDAELGIWVRIFVLSLTLSRGDSLRLFCVSFPVKWTTLASLSLLQ